MGVMGLVPFVNLSPGADDISVYPTAGTQTASPTTQISFRGISSLLAAQISVKGSSTGDHPGQVAPHSDNNGVSFLPDAPFVNGETVTVKITAPGHSLVGSDGDGNVTFKTFTKVDGLKLIPNPDGGGTPKKSQHFRSEPKLLPPSLKILAKKKGRASGDIFTAPKISRGQDGAMIADSKGQLIWWHRAPKGNSIYDFRVQQLDGKPVLTWWQGEVLFAKGYGQGVIYDSSLRQIAKIKGANGFQPDLHEFQLGPNGVAYTTGYQPVMADVSKLDPKGPKLQPVFDCIVQGIDIKTGLVVFEWHALDHVSITDTYARFVRGSAAPFDPYHVNSIEPESNGNLLLSARNANAIYEVDPKSGDIQWTLGGKSSTFKMGAGTSFRAQHDARRRDNGDVTVFDNGSGIPGSPLHRGARGIDIKIDQDAKTATLVHRLKRPQSVNAPSQGNVENLSNGNFFVGWGGSSPYMSEFSGSGSLVFDARLDPGENNSYRSYRFPWSARPYFPPKLAATHVKGSKLKVFATWNGATDVRQWEVLAGSSADSLTSIKTVFYNAYETSTKIPDQYKFVAVRAHAKDGSVLGTSKALAVK
jgi:hypothetical protein